MNKMHLLPIQDIKVSDKFLKSVPNEGKINRYRDAYLLANESKNSFCHCSGQVKPIVLDSHNVIVDGYIQYLIMEEMDENYCYCIYREVCKPYMLIQGISSYSDDFEQVSFEEYINRQFDFDEMIKKDLDKFMDDIRK